MTGVFAGDPVVETKEEEAAGTPVSAGSSWARLGRRVRKDRFAQAGIGLLVILALLAIFAPLVSFFSPIHGKLLDAYQGPSARHWLGTDGLGEDTWTRLVYGARVAWIAGLEAVAVGVIGGVPLGVVLGFRGGRADRWSSRVIDGIIAVPGLVLAVALISVIGPGVYQAMFAVGVVFATILVRFARGEAKSAREELWVTSALATGASEWRVMRRHVLPTIAPALIVQITLLFGAAILAEAGLSFIGLGMQPPHPSWGGMLTAAQDTISAHPWLAVPPGVAIAIMVLAVNAVGDGLGDALSQTRNSRGTLGGVTAAQNGADPAVLTLSPGETTSAPADEDEARRTVLRVEDLAVAFPGPDGSLVPVLDGVSLEVKAGEIMALVGETGSGKSILAKAVLGIVPPPASVRAGSIEVDLLEVTGRSNREMRRVRGRRVGVVFQEPQAALNPALRIGDQLTETLHLQAGLHRKEAATRAVELLDQVGIPNASRRVRAYPHEFSGGMAQRVMIALALACDPALLIADEPTTALDVTIQAQILDLLGQLREEHNMATLLITHDFGVVADVADRATVLYAGQVVESGSCDQIFSAPRHPYTAGLLQAVPRSRPRSGALTGIPGTVPLPGTWPVGCRFAARCPYVQPACREAVPPLTVRGGTSVRCIRADELDLDGSIERVPA